MIEINHEPNRVPDIGGPSKESPRHFGPSSGVEAAIIVAISRLIAVLSTISNLLLEQYRKMAEVNKQTALFSAQSVIQRGKDQFNGLLAQGLGGVIGGFGTCAAIGVGFLRNPYKPQLKSIDQEMKGIQNYQKAVESELTTKRNVEINERSECWDRPESEQETSHQQQEFEHQQHNAQETDRHNIEEERPQPREYNICRDPSGIEEIEMVDLSPNRIEEELLIQPESPENDENLNHQEEQNTLSQTTPSDEEIQNRLDEFQNQYKFTDESGNPLQPTEKYGENAKYTDKELIGSMDTYDLQHLKNLLNTNIKEVIAKKDKLLKQQSSHRSTHANNAQAFNLIATNSGLIGQSVTKKQEGEDDAKSQLSNAASQGEQGIMRELEKTANDATQQVKQTIDTFAAISNANRASAG